MGNYVPGEKGMAAAKGIRPSMAVEAAFEQGFYSGNYKVLTEPQIPFRPELEKIRQAALTTWPNTIMSFDSIVDWVGEGAIDPIRGEHLMGRSPLEPQKRAVLLINNGLFERYWDD